MRTKRSTVMLAATAILVAMASLCDLVTVSGNSMEDTLYDGDRVLIVRLETLSLVPWLRNRLVSNGTIVVSRHPARMSELLIKRVVAVESQRVRLDHGGLFVNDTQQRDLQTVRQMTGSWPPSNEGNVPRTVVVPPRHYFLLSDNRVVRFDSRAFGSVRAADIVGVALGVMYRPKRAPG